MGMNWTGFGSMFNMMQISFWIIFALALGIVVVGIVRGVCQWHRNNQSPRLNVNATVVSKRMDVRHHHHHHGGQAEFGMHTSTYRTYYATFEVDSGDRMELSVPTSEYGMLVEGDKGILTFQGTRYLGFQRQVPNDG